MDLIEYKNANKFFFDILSPKCPNNNVPIILNNPINANDHPPSQDGKLSSFKKAGKWTATKVTWNPQTKKPVVK